MKSDAIRLADAKVVVGEPPTRTELTALIRLYEGTLNNLAMLSDNFPDAEAQIQIRLQKAKQLLRILPSLKKRTPKPPKPDAWEGYSGTR